MFACLESFSVDMWPAQVRPECFQKPGLGEQFILHYLRQLVELRLELIGKPRFPLYV
jgi:hypothetical protein